MKKLLFISVVCISLSSIAQNDEQQLRESLKNDGLTQSVIDKLIQQRQELMQSGRKVNWTNLKKTPYTNGSCADIGVENGWGAWQAEIGDFMSANITFVSATTTAPRFNLTSGSGFDPCAPSSYTPNIPVV